MSPLVAPALIEPPSASCPPRVAEASPGPKNAVPAPESVTEKGEPDWKTVMPLWAHPAKKGRRYPSYLDTNAKSEDQLPTRRHVGSKSKQRYDTSRQDSSCKHA